MSVGTNLTITQAFDLPRPQDIRAMGFVVKLRESDPTSDETKQLAALRRQFLPYFVDGLYLGDCVSNAPSGVAAYGHQLGNRLLIATVNLTGTSDNAMECDLGLWLPSAKRGLQPIPGPSGL